MSVELKPFDFIANKYVKKVIDDNLDNLSNYSGINNSPTSEIKTNYDKTNGETVIQGLSNTFIILGRDRNAGKSSGNGGKGFTGASAIDIIAGHMGPMPLDTLFGQQIVSSKDFKNDAARIYLSQMSDVDSYFEIPKVQAKLGSATLDLEHGNGLSTVAAKADTVRLIARENIKIVTFHNSLLSSTASPINGGIDIVAGCNVMGANKTMQLQPMVKGNNLVELLRIIIERINDVQATVANFMKTQREINNLLSKHTHQSNKAGLPTSPVIEKDSSIKNFKLLTEVLPSIIDTFIYNTSLHGNYFNPINEKYINSVWNRVN